MYHILEYGRDHFDKGMVGITDIKAHHDQVRYGLILKSLLGRGIPTFLAVGCVRLHRNPKVSISLLESSTGVIDRRKGLMQGAGTACMLARVTVEDCFCSTMEKINNKALGLQIRSEELDLSFRLSLLSWSDNIFTIGPKFEEVAELTKILEGELWDLHRLHLKQEREILAASAYTFNSYERTDNFGSTWNIVSEAKVLGPILTSNGSCNLDVKRCLIQINKAFWANSKFLINVKIPIEKI